MHHYFNPLAYTCHDGLSGAGVIATVEGGKYHVVGVHVASHDDTEAPPLLLKKRNAELRVLIVFQKATSPYLIRYMATLRLPSYARLSVSLVLMQQS